MVPDEQLSLAIGRRGQNVRLASQLTGWDIDILTEAEESERRQKEFLSRTTLFMEALDVDEVVGQLLASEGFRSVEEIAYVEPEEVSGIEGFDEDTATEIQTRARDYLGRIEEEFDSKRRDLGVEDALKQVNGLTTPMLVKLGENDVKTVEDFAGCATDDLIGWTERGEGEAVKHAGYLDEFELSKEDAEAMIAAARRSTATAACGRAGSSRRPKPKARRPTGRNTRRPKPERTGPTRGSGTAGGRCGRGRPG